ncbi:pentapeptide repeat-containing protein [Mycobacteroides abscessus]|uniref:pentapeptide repeat-containing protein n=1 Tax=Mycobacteroides abscessus TaxID=36809 RepID=UPI000926A976|nr:pentapeptide repeat-containing protein [Mycobacteroides abscessus]SHP72399.1 Uncharacterized protein conserved in bacteria [Mycobacteroides abscessus subsp. abscessus]SHT13515.1 Uncharacterized protein conserved in bacteria [Mycobacteroides abscessus subsp. abscessus]SHT77631.1 Uncharacterized protein conserved in bacteria [Mycobacteroides abscessus subsp. abscessus]SKE17058.1 Uncharacterized protein conserved in bacteria [Mycobacteroides abscessus subsp. abscessus]SKH76787.1 Uncharacterize
MAEEALPELAGEPDESKSGDTAIDDEAESSESVAEEDSPDNDTERQQKLGSKGRREKIQAHLKEYTPTYGVLVSACAAVVAVCALAASVYFGVNQRAVADKQIDAAERQNAAAETQLALARGNQAAEQFNRALEMLGSNQPNLRINAIDELVDLARFQYHPEYVSESNGPYVEPVVTNLLRFIDTNSIGNSCTSPDSSIGVDVEYAINMFSSGQEGRLFKSVVPDLPYDRQTGQVQRGDDVEPRYVSQHHRLFSKVTAAEHCWARIQLRATLPRVSFENISMPQARFLHTYLDDAVFNGDDLNGIVVNGGSLRNAHFDGASLIKARLIPAEDQNAQAPVIEGATFVNARMCGAVISSDVRNVDFTSARLYGADLREATNLRLAKWSDVRFDQATLWPPNFPQPGTPTDGPPNCA